MILPVPKPKKKLPADFQAFLRWLVRSPVHTTNVFILSLLLVMLPGQNLLQTLALTPQTSSLKPFPLDVTFDLARSAAVF